MFVKKLCLLDGFFIKYKFIVTPLWGFMVWNFGLYNSYTALGFYVWNFGLCNSATPTGLVDVVLPFL